MSSPDPLLDPPAWAPDWLPTVHDTERIRLFRWVIWAVMIAGFGGCVLRGADQPADPELGAPTVVPSSTTTIPAGDLAARVGTIIVDLVSATGDVLRTCMLDADLPEERSQGLMFVSDTELAGYDGMLFRYDAPAAGQFYMFNTLQPLRIAWYDENGAWVAAADMVPCESTDAAECPRYPAGAPFLYGIELTTTSPLNPIVLEGSSIAAYPGESCQA